MKTPEHTRRADDFEQVLLSHAKTCYSVAFALTRDSADARDLTRDVLTWAWHFHDQASGQINVKAKLLKALGERFLQDYR